ncbi:zinc metalloprotease HtpX [Motiliproteus sp. SC1-56]|uniref:zinc metalloprotease HtpX n=1 Tax=Motiliproteus sp. SC1-56 TaxID=2799565 RepID=UPI001A8C79B5|nr:zinc metalloprotease HtpX [Motiliproteus sp. SC1-56]
MHREALESSRRLNRWHSWVLLLAMGSLLALIAWLLAGPYTALGAFLVLVLAHQLNRHLPPRLLMRLYRARPLAYQEAPDLHRALKELSRRAGLPREPVLYYIDSPQPNAIAVGTRKDSAIAISDGLVRQLDWQPLLGVIAHELAHIRHQDVQLLTFAELIGRLVNYLVLVGLVLIGVSLPLVLLTDLKINWLAPILLLLAPLLCRRLQLSLSQTREFEADRGSAELLGTPLPLINALRLLEYAPDGPLHRFFLPHRRRPRPADVGTHPSTEARIQRLKALEPDRGWRVPLPP